MTAITTAPMIQLMSAPCFVLFFLYMIPAVPTNIAPRMKFEISPMHIVDPKNICMTFLIRHTSIPYTGP